MADALAERLALLDAAEAAGWPKLRAPGVAVRGGEAAWRQRAQLADAAELAALAAGLAAQARVGARAAERAKVGGHQSLDAPLSIPRAPRTSPRAYPVRLRRGGAIGHDATE